MRTLLIGSLVVGSLFTLQQREYAAPTPEQAAKDAGELFKAKCIACHQPPDSRFETDRAWLNQVADTA